MATEQNSVIALVSGYLGFKGKSVQVIEGASFEKNDPIVKLYPHLFGAPATLSRSRVEQATAAPGERR
jgi:hypothetical protein